MTTLSTSLVDGNTWAAADQNTVNAQINTNTTGIATLTTNLAAAQLAGVTTQTANYTLVLGDAGDVVLMNKSSAVTLTVPPNSSVAFGTGASVMVVQLGAGQVTVVAGSGVTLRYPASLTTRAQYSMLVLLKIGTDTWLVSGDAT